MRALISHFILPLPIFWILLLTALILFIRKKKLSRIAFGFSLLWLFIVSTPFLPDLLVKHLEDQYSVISKEAIKNTKGPVHVLVLGSGHTDDEKLSPNSQLSESALARLCEGIRIQRLIPGSTLISSGYGGSNEMSNALVVARTAILLGIDPNAVKMQENPENTFQEATNYKEVFGDTGTLIVVTSAAHMPRSIYLFKKTGLNPIAAPANFLVKKGTKKPPYYWLPSSGNIEKMESAIHEYIGLLWYRLGGI